jgi:hypothetical protein
MAEIRYVVVTNHCPEKVKIFFRYIREIKARKKEKVSITLSPGETSPAIPYTRIIGAKDWEVIKQRTCIKIEETTYEPRFIYLENNTDETVSIPITVSVAKEGQPRHRTSLDINPHSVSKPIDKKSLAKKVAFNKLVSDNKIRMREFIDVGPSFSLNPDVVGSYYGEEVYICYKCGRPIVFRDHPPRPIHI